VVGSGRRLRIAGVDYGTTELDGVRSAEPIVLGGGPEAEPEAETRPKTASKP
jgi:hypothetical protein